MYCECTSLISPLNSGSMYFANPLIPSCCLCYRLAQLHRSIPCYLPYRLTHLHRSIPCYLPYRLTHLYRFIPCYLPDVTPLYTPAKPRPLGGHGWGRWGLGVLREPQDPITHLREQAGPKSCKPSQKLQDIAKVASHHKSCKPSQKLQAIAKVASHCKSYKTSQKLQAIAKFASHRKNCKPSQKLQAIAKVVHQIHNESTSKAT